MSIEARYKTDILPLEEDLERFAIPYTSEKFTRAEKGFLKPFFTNTDRPIFAIKGLPEEVVGALSSRYSRATKSLRRMFLDEYISPIVSPESQKDWGSFSNRLQKEALETRGNFLGWIEHMNETGGIDDVVNVQRGRQFFDKWLAQFGDDSIAEMGGVHVCIEGLSNIAVKEIEDKRIGVSPLEKSSRYVQFWEKRPDGQYQFIVPGELRGTRLEGVYTEAVGDLFDTYSSIADPYKEYIERRYPIGDDETERSFQGSRSAKRFDDIRDLLPFATQTSVALYGNGRAFEDIINRLASQPLGELRWWGQQMERELQIVVPSFVARPKTERGAQTQLYRANVNAVRDEFAGRLKGKAEADYPHWSRLISHTQNPETEVISTFLFQSSGLSLDQIRKQVGRWSDKRKSEVLDSIFAERNFGDPEAKREVVRFRKVPRAFENANFLFEVWGRGGDWRDLHRHRQQTQERQKITTNLGYDLEQEVLESPFADEVKKALEKSASAFNKISTKDTNAAQYVVPFGFVQHWYMNLTAREIYWMSELRTGPQGREHYRQICQNISRQATEVAPLLFAGLKTDRGSYALSRRESEKKIDKKLKLLEKK